MDLDQIGALLTEREGDLNRRVGQRDALVAQRAGLTGQIGALESKQVLLAKVGILLSSIADERQDQVRAQVEGIVTRGLQTVFDPTLSFHLVQSTKANATTIDFVVRTTFADGEVLETPVTDARGGGVAATIGFLLRVVILLLTPTHRRILILDETFAHLSDEYVGPMAQFVAALAKDAGMQIIMVTHQPEFAAYAGQAYRFSLTDNGTTKVSAQ